ncbi:MAG: coenzyme F420-0:L-glutamate ligase [Thermoleophilaceae bacterium]
MIARDDWRPSTARTPCGAGRARRVGRGAPGRAGVIVSRTHHGLVCANAGVDASNTAEEDELVLLPADPDGSARALRAGLERERGVRPAVLVSDSFGRAWRLGQTDVAIGLAGLAPSTTGAAAATPAVVSCERP